MRESIRTFFRVTVSCLVFSVVVLGCRSSSDDAVDTDSAAGNAASDGDTDVDVDVGGDADADADNDAWANRWRDVETEPSYDCPTNIDGVACVSRGGCDGEIKEGFSCEDGKVCCDAVVRTPGNEPCPVQREDVFCDFFWVCFEVGEELMAYQCEDANFGCCLSHEAVTDTDGDEDSEASGMDTDSGADSEAGTRDTGDDVGSEVTFDTDTPGDTDTGTSKPICPDVAGINLDCMGASACAKRNGGIQEVYRCADEKDVCCLVPEDTETEASTEDESPTEEEKPACPTLDFVSCEEPSVCTEAGGSIQDAYTCDGETVCCLVVPDTNPDPCPEETHTCYSPDICDVFGEPAEEYTCASEGLICCELSQ